jgi:hypothetical protein
MKDIIIECPKCEREITLTTKEIKRSIERKSETGNVPLVSCPECCRVLILPEVPKDEAALETWEPNVDNTVCIPFLDDTAIRMPNGMVEDLGVRKYTAGSGETGLAKRAYMRKYGINPECAYTKNPSMGGKPIKLGK